MGFKTPGKDCHTDGEKFAGPLGQGHNVLVYYGWKTLSRQIQPRYYEVVTYHTYVLASDGDLMEGISRGSFISSHLNLDKLITLYDSQRYFIRWWFR